MPADLVRSNGLSCLTGFAKAPGLPVWSDWFEPSRQPDTVGLGLTGPDGSWTYHSVIKVLGIWFSFNAVGKLQGPQSRFRLPSSELIGEASVLESRGSGTGAPRLVGSLAFSRNLELETRNPEPGSKLWSGTQLQSASIIPRSLRSWIVEVLAPNEPNEPNERKTCLRCCFRCQKQTKAAKRTIGNPRSPWYNPRPLETGRHWNHPIG